MIGSNEYLMLLLNDINLGGSPPSNSFSPLFLPLARFLILFPLLLMLRRIVLRIVVSMERYFEVFDIRVRLALEPDLALSPEVHTEEAFARYHNRCI